MEFELLKTDAQARAGLLKTPHGLVEVPVFMPVATQSTIKAMTFEQLDACGTEIALANTYHLYLRPGSDLIEEAGGLNSWTNYSKPFLTDSGGFQIFSQTAINKCKVTDKGAHFVDIVTGDKHFLSPADAIRVQNQLGADIIMAFDHCPCGQASYEETQDAMDRTHAWARECMEAHARSDQALFPIVQGGIFKDLREKSVSEITSLNAPGYAIGGVSVGESRDDIDEIVRFTTPMLPSDKPRYLMGIGTHEDIVKAIAAGIDMFDCVMPTRIARHGSFFDEQGVRQQIKAQKYIKDFAPLVYDCSCYTCKNHSRAYLNHLWKARESVLGTLLSIHNITYLIQLTKKLRKLILEGKFQDFYQRHLEAQLVN